jgi:hypothetical protein
MFAEGSDRVNFGALPAGATTVRFTPLGQIDLNDTLVAPALGAAPLREVDVTSAIAGARRLNVLIGGGASGVAGQGSRTGIKICDPKWPATDPKGCPA